MQHKLISMLQLQAASCQLPATAARAPSRPTSAQNERCSAREAKAGLSTAGSIAMTALSRNEVTTNILIPYASAAGCLLVVDVC